MGDGIKVLTVPSPCVARARDTTSNFSSDFIVRIGLLVIGG